MKKILYLTASILFGLLLIMGGCKEDLPGELYGEVTDKATGEPIKSASVELQPIGQRMTTGTDGRYSFKELESGTYKLYITKTGYEDCLSGEILLKSGQSFPQNVPMEKLPPSLQIVNDKRLNIDSLDFGIVEDDVMRSFNIFNYGSVTLQWQVTSAADWIAHISKENGELNSGDLQTVIVKIDRAKLKEGENRTTIHITSNDGSAKLLLKAKGRSRPVVNTLDATDVKRTSAIFHGELISMGEPTYFERGFVYGLSPLPTIENTIRKMTVAVTEHKAFQATATELEEFQTYYIRAYAINSAGTAYSTNEVKCQAAKALPSVKTESVTHKSIAARKATLNGTIVDVGDPAYTGRGFVYSVSHNPMVGDADVTKKEVSGQGTGIYSVNLTNMEMDVVYYVRAYAVNEVGTAYGDEVVMDFNPLLPDVQTQSVTDVMEHSATLKGVIKSVGDPVYTERGFIYGTMPEPSFNVPGIIKRVAPGSGEGTYTASVSNLIAGTVYYVRAYAKVGENLSYGEILNFQTAELPYVVLDAERLMVQKEDLGYVTWASGFSLCKNSTLAGFKDWRLPTRDELTSLYLKKDEIGGFTSSSYWSGTRCDENGTYGTGYQEIYPIYVYFGDGASYYDPDGVHGSKRKVRAVRTITK